MSLTDEAQAAAAAAVAAVDEVEFADLESMEDLLNEPGAKLKPIGRGDVIEGLIVGIEPDELLVDIGLKAEGVVPQREMWDFRSEEPRPVFSVGDTVLAYVVQPEGDGPALLSLRRAVQEKVWRATQDLFEKGTIIETAIIEYNKGGVLVDVGPRGFVPLSQLTSLRRGGSDETEDELAARLAELVGRKIHVKIIELDRRRNRLILSERVAERELRAKRREVLLEELQVGQIRKGIVSNICSFGAFIDLGGADGLAHISELSWSRVESPEDVLKPGQEIDVYVLSLDREDKKIALSLRRATKDPWESLDERYAVNQTVDGEITKLAPFGAFVRLEDGIEGLAHTSDLGDAALDSLHEGDTGRFRILSIDSSRRRIRLSPVDLDVPLDDAFEAQGSLAAVADVPAEADADTPADEADADEPADELVAEAPAGQADTDEPADEVVAEAPAEADADVSAIKAVVEAPAGEADAGEPVDEVVAEAPAEADADVSAVKDIADAENETAAVGENGTPTTERPDNDATMEGERTAES